MERKTKELNFLKHFLWKNLLLTDFFPNFGLSNKNSTYGKQKKT